MKTTKHIAKTLLQSALPLLMVAALPTFTACSDDNEYDDNNAAEKNVEEFVPATSFDDLSYFQNAIIQTDSLGGFQGRVYGDCLLSNDTTQLFVGVENVAEAEEIFRRWIAPDVELSANVPSTQGLTANLTDEEGVAQGTVYFQPLDGTEGKLAQVIASSGTAIKHFSTVTFLKNEAWPYNSSTLYAANFNVGDVRRMEAEFICRNSESLTTSHKEMIDFICIREGGNGKKPYFVGISHNREAPAAQKQPWMVANAGDGRDIGTIFSKNWDYWVNQFAHVDGGPLVTGKSYFVHYTEDKWFDSKQGFVNLSDNGSLAKFDACYRDPRGYALLRVNNKDFYKNSLIPDDGMGSKTDSYDHLFDGDTRVSHWYADAKKLVDGYAYVEFHAPEAGIPTVLSVTTAYNAKQYPDFNPGGFDILAKLNRDDEWTKLGTLKCSNWWWNVAYIFDFRLDLAGVKQKYKYFRLDKIRSVKGPGTSVQMGEIMMQFK